MVKAAPPVFPLPDHRSMADVLSDENFGCTCDMPDGEEGHDNDCPVIAACIDEYGGAAP